MKNKTSDQKYLQSFGKNLEKLIKLKGYKSIYDFWVNKGEGISRSNIQALIKGETNPSLLTIISLAKRLKIEPSDLLKF